MLSDRVRDPVADLVPRAPVLVGAGQGVDPAAYGELDDLVSLLEAELVGTQKVTDQGWLPKTRQVGVTGHAVAPRLYMAISLSGKYNHTVGVRRAGTVLAVNADPSAPISDTADIGIVGDRRETVARLTAELAVRMGAPTPLPWRSGRPPPGSRLREPSALGPGRSPSPPRWLRTPAPHGGRPRHPVGPWSLPRSSRRFRPPSSPPG